MLLHRSQLSNLFIFQISMPKGRSLEKRVMSLDLNQGSSLWCWECGESFVLWGRELLDHLAVKHEIFYRTSGKRMRSVKYYLDKGTFKRNYRTHHQCLICGHIMEFTEELVKKHFNKPPHINVDRSTFDAYLSQLTLRDKYFIQINIHRNDGSWDDILNSMPEESFVPVGLGVRWDHGTVSALWWQSQQLRARAFDNGMEVLEGQGDAVIEEVMEGLDGEGIEEVEEGMAQHEENDRWAWAGMMEEVMEGLEGDMVEQRRMWG